MEKYICYLSLGANLGDRLGTIRQAVEMLDNTGKIHVKCVSSMYETPPWGKLDQPPFINGAAAVETVLAPVELLAAGSWHGAGDSGSRHAVYAALEAIAEEVAGKWKELL